MSVTVIAKRIIVLIICCSELCSAVSAQSIQFNRFDEKMGYAGGGNYGCSTMLQDQQGFIWFATINGLNRFDGHHFKVFQYDHLNTYGISSNEVTSLAEDQNGNIWLGTAGGGLNKFDPCTERFTSYHPRAGDSNSISSDYINHILIDSQGRIWIGNRFDGLDLFLPGEESFTHLELRDDRDTLHYTQGIIHLAEGPDGEIWIAANDGLFRYDPEKDSFSCHFQSFSGANRYKDPRMLYFDKDGKLWVSVHFMGLGWWDESSQELVFSGCQLRDKNGTPDYLIESILEDATGNLWLGSRNGLYSLDPNDCSSTRYDHDPARPESILSGEVMDMLLDRQGNIWLMNWAQRAINNFNPYQNIPKPLVREPLNAMSVIDSQTLLLASADRLWRYDLQNGQQSEAIRHNYLSYFQAYEKSSVYIKELIVDPTGKYLVGTFGGGLYVIDPKTEKIDHFLGEQAINQMITLDDQRVLIATSWGIMAYHPETGLMDEDPTYHGIPFQQGEQFTYIEQDRNNNLWLATAYGGVHYLDHLADTTFQFSHDQKNPNSLSSNSVRCLFEDRNGNIWIATDVGLDAYRPDTGVFTHYSDQDGLLESLSINAITQDAAGFLWLTTPNYLYRFDPDSRSIRKFYEKDAFSIIDVEPKFFHQNDSTLVFSARTGLNLVNTKMMEQRNTILNVVLTDFKLFNKTVGIGDFDSLLVRKINATDRIRLKYHQNSIALSYQGISFTEPELLNYAYKLEGFDDEWQLVGAKNEAVYTNLSPGDYTFLVKSRYQNEAWTESGKQLRIHIGLPWWKTPPALAGWFLLFLGISYLIYRILLRRQLAIAEASRLKEIDTFKTQLYTSITHEFRTPITVILGIADQLMEKWDALSTEKAHQHLGMITRNSEGLLKLVNQMLDLAKIEANKMELRWISGEIISYLAYLLEAMDSLAQSKNIELEKDFDIEQLVMDYDPDKLKIVLFNLLSNAIKFTPGGGKVRLQVSVIVPEDSRKEYLQLQIKDTGIGIEADELDKIFQPFYQINTSGEKLGTGIGLSLTKGLVELMAGKIEVHSRPGEYSVFTILLPIRHQALPIDTVIPSRIPLEALAPSPTPNKSPGDLPSSQPQPLILIIEDNDDLILYLQECLQDSYSILVAKNGEVGVQRALETIPDAIISDVMMPLMDGFEVCRQLKNDERTSHIPIIMLTAKATIEDRLSGLERGADAYLTKPFIKRELLIRLEQTIQLRQSLKKRYTGGHLSAARSNAMEKFEDAFMTKVNKIIIDHLDDTSFDSAGLCQALLISNTQLYRKLKALTGESIAVYIRSVRLYQAKDLLVQSDLKISEIAYRVGFKDLSYFSRCYNKKFGKTPQNFRKELNAG